MEYYFLRLSIVLSVRRICGTEIFCCGWLLQNRYKFVILWLDLVLAYVWQVKRELGESPKLSRSCELRSSFASLWPLIFSGRWRNWSKSEDLPDQFEVGSTRGIDFRCRCFIIFVDFWFCSDGLCIYFRMISAMTRLILGGLWWCNCAAGCSKDVLIMSISILVYVCDSPAAFWILWDVVLACWGGIPII